MLKKRSLIFYMLNICLMLSVNNVKALESEYLKNSNGVILTQKEYEIINQIYGINYFEKMTQDDYEWLSDLNINDNELEIKSAYDLNSNNFLNIEPLGTSHATASKKLTIVKSCDSKKCTILTTAKWLVEPKNRSYDVIGARFDGTSLYNDTITTRVQSSLGIEKFNSENNIRKYTVGFGVSVKLPSSASNIIIDQKFYVNKKGTIYASYQHSAKQISLATSKLYTIGASGAGGVFSFYGAATDAFDQMGGVDITL